MSAPFYCSEEDLATAKAVASTVFTNYLGSVIEADERARSEGAKTMDDKMTQLAKADATISQLLRELREISAALGFDGQLAPVTHSDRILRARRLRAEAKRAASLGGSPPAPNPTKPHHASRPLPNPAKPYTRRDG